MGGKTKSKFAICVLVTVCLTITQLELTAFAEGNGEATPKGQEIANGVVPTASTSFELAAVQTPAPTTQTTPSQSQPASPAPSRHTWRWILIGTAATAAVIGTIILLHNPKAEPVITVGAPTIGNPQ